MYATHPEIVVTPNNAKTLLYHTIFSFSNSSQNPLRCEHQLKRWIINLILNISGSNLCNHLPYFAEKCVEATQKSKPKTSHIVMQVFAVQAVEFHPKCHSKCNHAKKLRLDESLLKAIEVLYLHSKLMLSFM